MCGRLRFAGPGGAAGRQEILEALRCKFVHREIGIGDGHGVSWRDSWAVCTEGCRLFHGYNIEITSKLVLLCATALTSKV